MGFKDTFWKHISSTLYCFPPNYSPSLTKRCYSRFLTNVFVVSTGPKTFGRSSFWKCFGLTSHKPVQSRGELAGTFSFVIGKVRYYWNTWIYKATSKNDSSQITNATPSYISTLSVPIKGNHHSGKTIKNHKRTSFL